jgi:hypothetical protein
MLWSALTIIADIAEHPPDWGTIFTFPDHEVVLPFALKLDEVCTIPFDGSLRPHYFALSLYLPVDAVVEEYIREWRDDVRAEFPGEWESSLNALGHVSIGYFYLSTGEPLRLEQGDGRVDDLIPLSIDVAATRMNSLFEESSTVRDLFFQLAEKTGAVYMLLDREVDALLVWRNGERRNDYIEDPEMTLQEIERIVETRDAAG